MTNEHDAASTRLLLGATADVLRSIGDPGLLSHVAIVGGLVPTLLGAGSPLPETGEHTGTSDLDLVISLELLSGETDEYYGNIAEGLTGLGLTSGGTGDDKDKRWQWQGRHRDLHLTVELLSPLVDQRAGVPQQPSAEGNDNVGDGDDIRTLGLTYGHLVRPDRTVVAQDVDTRHGRIDGSEFPVANLASWLALKADALERRDKNKDAYDVVWLVTALGPAACGRRIDASPIWAEPLMATDLARQLGRLDAIFATTDHHGPGSYAEYLGAPADERANRRHAVAAIQQLRAATAQWPREA